MRVADEEPEFDDYGEPAESTPDAEPPSGTSGAEDGVSPWSPEQYEPPAPAEED